MADDLFTDAEKAMMSEDGSVSEEEITEDEHFEEPAPVVEEIVTQQEAVEAPNDDAPIPEPTPEIIEAPTALEQSDRYKEVTMTETVPPELDAALANIAKKFDDSEIDITEYLKQRALIDRQITTYQIEEANSQKAYNSWMDAQDVFMNENRHYVENKILYGALDSAVQEVKADPRSRGLTPTQIIAAADYLVRDSFGQSQKVEQKQETQKPELKIVKPHNVLPNVPTLANIPASSQNDTGTDPFSAIERLSGDAREAAVARLTPDQYEAYLRA